MNYLTDGSHALVFGTTGSGTRWGGKTAVANWWHSETIDKGWRDLSIFFNPGEEPGIKGRTVESMRELADAYRDGARKIDFQPATLTGAPELEELAEFIRHVDGSKLLVVDEAQDVDDTQALRWAFKRGSKADLKTIAVAQRAWDLNDTVRTNATLTVYVGPYNDGFDRFFESELRGTCYDTDAGPVTPKEHVRATHDPYCWSVFDAGSDLLEVNNPVSKEYVP